ncbi:type 1 glutamine amidotransferase [Leekyejoonella antrihumi]|uniref:Glutamine amidotransferase domain-containing protein n=1 Tax=Leekyejoonella antrihumi TaxID=1660198 RepID=A0A563DW57_9MICO|nr:gamma-glutamyl-gamma-aminobutyrate hydrolase family protein [Leekyejoonella antrihumi]TWP34211.1 hypothetical protein FGL98_18290 [Leekyejoonella antrihumi]
MGVRVDVVADRSDEDAGFVGQRLVEQHGGELVLHDRDALGGTADFAQTQLLLLLGSARSAHDPAQRDVVEAESQVVRGVLDSGVPVLAICYGSQLLARALGGSAHQAKYPEIGWYSVESGDPDLCPPGPWAQFHSDAFTPPPTARVLGSNGAGCQAFSDDSHRARALGWQFHPEVTAARFSSWADTMRDYCTTRGIDPDALIAEAPSHEPRLREATFALTDSAVAWLFDR